MAKKKYHYDMFSLPVLSASGGQKSVAHTWLLPIFLSVKSGERF